MTSTRVPIPWPRPASKGPRDVPPRTTSTSIEAPVLVSQVDLAAPLPSGLSAARPDGTRYTGVRLLVRRGPDPLGVLDIGFDVDELSADELDTRLRLARPEWFAPVDEAGVTTPWAEAVGYLAFATVVVPSIFQRVEQLERSARALNAMDHPRFEVIIVDNRPEPDPTSWASLESLPRVRVVAESTPGISAARNRGIREAGGGIVAFTDDDVVVDVGWLRALATRFVTEPEVDCVTGLVVPAELETASQVAFECYDGLLSTRFHPETYRIRDVGAHGLSRDRYTVEAHRAGVSVPRTFWLYQLGGFFGANMAFRTESLAVLGPFDEGLGTGTRARGGEDIEMFARLLFRGHSIGYEPRALLHHAHRRTVAELQGQIRGYGTGFAAMLTAAIRDDPRHLVGLSRAVAAVVSRPQPERGGPAAEEFPAELRRLERSGMLAGPGAYVLNRMKPYLERAGMTGDRGLGERMRDVGGGVLSDLREAARHTLLNTIAGSMIVPRVGRAALYRAAGMPQASLSVSPHCRISGSPNNVSIGRGTYINVGCFLEAYGPITIGNDCAVGMEVLVVTSTHPLNAEGWDPASVGRPVVIGDRVWLGARCIVLPGVTIGDDVVVAAGSIVTKDCAPGGIYAGAPARRVRELRGDGGR